MRRVALISIMLYLTCGIVAYSQKTKKVTATYTYYAPETMSVEEAKRIALERAKIHAIEEEFGTIVSQSTSTIVTNSNGESDTRFFSTGGSDIKGEWIETIGEPTYNIHYEDKQLIIHVSTKGIIKENNNQYTDISVITLRNGIEEKYESTQFANGDDFYLRFQSPEDGYLLVYLIDYSSEMVFFLLPYINSSDLCYKVQRNKVYTFFSNKAASEDYTVDEYTLTCEDNSAQNELIVLFSPRNLSPARLNDNSSDTPRTVDLSYFRKWLSNLQKNNDTLTINKQLLTINNKQ